MAYTKTNWSSGDTITASKINHLENGVEIISEELEQIEQKNVQVDFNQTDDTQDDFIKNKPNIIKATVVGDVLKFETVG